MKRKLLIGLLVMVICITLVGCEENGSKASSLELNEINNKIIEYFLSDNVEYDNLSFNYVDMTNKVVVVGLLENTKEYQDKFKKLVVDSKHITFVQGENLNDLGRD